MSTHPPSTAWLMMIALCGAISCAPRAPVEGEALPFEEVEGPAEALEPPNPEAPTEEGAPPPLEIQPRGLTCAPQPTRLSAPLAREIYAWVQEARGCALSGRDSAAATHTFEGDDEAFAPAGQALEGGLEALPSFTRAWVEVRPNFGFPMEEEHLAIIEPRIDPGTGALEIYTRINAVNSSAVRGFLQRYDAEGHLLYEEERFSGDLWFTLEQTWDGDQLVEARREDLINGEGVTRYRWAWEGGRLSSSTLEAPRLEAPITARYRYDVEGRLVEIERAEGDEVYLRQSWRYDADGRLLGRVIQAGSTDRRIHLTPPDDHHGRPTHERQETWSEALWAEGEGCNRAPISWTHGYPAAERAYDLGWVAAERPAGIDALYGFGPAYTSAQEGWFGHEAVDGGYAVDAYNGPFTSEIEYDAWGRMARERYAAEGLDLRRARVFEGDALVKDTRWSTWADRPTLEARLSFEWAGDRLASRALWFDDRLISEQRWEREAGVTRHAIRHADLALYGAPLLSAEDVPEAELVERVVEIREIYGREVHFVDGAQVRAVTRDDLGRIVELEEGQGRWVFEFDPRTGVRSFRGEDWDGDGIFEGFLRYELSADGQVVSREWRYQLDEEPSFIERFDFTCR